MTKFKTSDLGIAAYLLCKGVRLASASRGSGRYEFVFEDPDDLCISYSIDYVNSECSRFDAQIKNLKNILKSS